MNKIPILVSTVLLLGTVVTTCAAQETTAERVIEVQQQALMGDADAQNPS